MSEPVEPKAVSESAGGCAKLASICWVPWPCEACASGATAIGYLSRCHEANGPLPQLPKNELIDHVVALERRWLLQWVRSCPHRDAVSETLPFLGEGSEHAVYLRVNSARVIKVTLPGLYGDYYYLDGGRMAQAQATPAEYLVRMRMVTKQFGLPWVALGIGEDGRIVSGQRFISGMPPTQREVDEFLLSEGLTPVRQQFWLWNGKPRRGYEAWIGDARADNFVRTPRGLIPIDLRMWSVPTTPGIEPVRLAKSSS